MALNSTLNTIFLFFLSSKETYPQTSPKLEILPRGGEMQSLSDDPLLTQLLQVLYQSAKESIGEPMLYNLVDVAKEWLQGRTIGGEDGEQDEEEDVVAGMSWH